MADRFASSSFLENSPAQRRQQGRSIPEAKAEAPATLRPRKPLKNLRQELVSRGDCHLPTALLRFDAGSGPGRQPRLASFPSRPCMRLRDSALAKGPLLPSTFQRRAQRAPLFPQSLNRRGRLRMGSQPWSATAHAGRLATGRSRFCIRGATPKKVIHRISSHDPLLVCNQRGAFAQTGWYLSGIGGPVLEARLTGFPHRRACPAGPPT